MPRGSRAARGAGGGAHGSGASRWPGGYPAMSRIAAASSFGLSCGTAMKRVSDPPAMESRERLVLTILVTYLHAGELLDEGLDLRRVEGLITIHVRRHEQPPRLRAVHHLAAPTISSCQRARRGADSAAVLRCVAMGRGSTHAPR
jgi:hypothetical protein